jgi:hypothetical protein
MQELIQVNKKGQPLPKLDAWSAMSVCFDELSVGLTLQLTIFINSIASMSLS